MPDRRLGAYRAKRDFSTTPEPSGAGEAPRAEAPRFVIHEHHATRLHWDLRLEHDGALASWALPRGLPWAPKENLKAVRTEEHPLEYLDFHGDIPKGQYGAGRIDIWDRGELEVLKWAEDKVEVELRGDRVRARFALFPTGPQGKDWMIHRMDAPVEGGWGWVSDPMPERLAPMLARAAAADRIPDDDDRRWAYEVKWDGVRAICFSTPGRLRLVSRSGNEITGRYPELSPLNRALSMRRAVLDGEIVAFGSDGRPSFEALQRRMHVERDAQVRRLAASLPVTYMIFDLLWLDGRSLIDLPYEQRRAALAELALDGERFRAPEHIVGHGRALLAATREQGLEGIVAKRLDSRYKPGRRSASWLKIKNVERQELLIVGWVPGEGGRRSSIGALLLGVGGDEGLRYAGRVGTGFTDRTLAELREWLAPLTRDDSPLAISPALPREAVFVEPRLIAEVEHMGWTSEGVLRAPSFKGLRDDKAPEEVVREPSAVVDAAPSLVLGERLDRGAVRARVLGPPDRELRLTNLDKPLWPTGHTKGDLIRYLLAIAPVLLPHIGDRPLTLKRYPDGVEGEFFYEKQAPSHRPGWVQTTRVATEGGRPIDYVVASEPVTLAWLGNLADLELHTPMHRAGDVGRPTMVAFDLDPGPPAGLLECLRVAVLLHGMFEHLGLLSLPKTSGGKGLQVYVPLNAPDVTYAQTKGFAKAVAELLEAEQGDLVVSRQTKRLRRGKVLVDWSQNDEHKTTVSAYSPRARERPTVSTPLSWEEVHDALRAEDPERLVFDMDEVPARVEEHGDLFAEAVTHVQRLPG